MKMKKIFIILFLPFISFSQLIEIPVDTMNHSYHETTIKGEKVKYIAEVGTQPVWDENGDGEIDCREAVRASAKIILLVITTAWLFMGLGLTVVGIMAISNFGQYSGLVEAEVLYVVVIVGIVMMLVTIIGYCGIFKLKKILLIIYALSLFLLCIVMIIIGTSLLAYLSNVDASKSSFNSARESAKQNEERIQNFIYCSYV